MPLRGRLDPVAECGVWSVECGVDVSADADGLKKRSGSWINFQPPLCKGRRHEVPERLLLRREASPDASISLQCKSNTEA